MSALALAPPSVPPALPGPYAEPPAPEALAPHPETVRLVRDVVRSLLLESPGFLSLEADDRRALAHNIVRVGSYLAECVRDDWYQSDRLGQRPVVRTRRAAPLAQAQTAGQDFQPAAASQIGRVTGETLRAIAFPVFVSDLIRGTFNAIGDASQRQMDQYMQLLENVSKTVDQFMADNVSDDNARSWLAERYPQHIELRDGHAVVRAGAEDRPVPSFRVDLDLDQDVPLDDSAIEDSLVPGARRKLAQSRLQLLSSLVLMGINRIVVTGGKIRATMGFHISARDQAHAESASQVGVGVSAQGSGAIGPFSIGASMSFSYVSSSKADSNAELNTQADLTGEVEIHFQSDYFPIERFADASGIDAIRSHTPVPAASTPTTPLQHDAIPWGDTSPQRAVPDLGPPRAPSTTPFVEPPHGAAPPPLPGSAPPPTTHPTPAATTTPPTTPTTPPPGPTPAARTTPPATTPPTPVPPPTTTPTPTATPAPTTPATATPPTPPQPPQPPPVPAVPQPTPQPPQPPPPAAPTT